MPHSICIIDDGFLSPATALEIENHKYYSIATMSLLLGQDWPGENPLKELCSSLVGEKDGSGNTKWKFRGFSHPNFFDEAYEFDNFRPNIIIFDWEYATASDFDQCKFLEGVLQCTHVHIFVFSGADKINEIKGLIDGNLDAFPGRIDILEKSNSGEDNHAELLELISQKLDNNFSFKFGNKLRQAVNKSLDDVLLRLSAMDIEKVISCLGKEHTDPVDTDVKELIGERIKNNLIESNDILELLEDKKIDPEAAFELVAFIAEKTKNDIVSYELPHETREQTDGENEDVSAEIMEQLWSYRLYHSPHENDEFVRTGDLIKRADSEGVEELYLVVTPLCQLERFWSKTHGQLNLVKLYCFDKQKVHLKEQGMLTKNSSSVKGSERDANQGSIISSISNSITRYGGDPLSVPYVPIESELRNFLLFPKEISAEKIELPETQKVKEAVRERDTHLTYDILDGKFNRVVTISEPFLSPIIEHIFSSLKGYGAPDFPANLKISLAKSYQNVFTEAEQAER